MKKIISLMVALALFTATAFATPLSVAASFPKQAQAVTSSASADLDNLFADVAAVPLTDEEALAVEGEGIGLAIVGLATGYISGVVCWGAGTAYTALTGGNIGTPREQMNSMLTSAVVSATYGFVTGLLSHGP